MYHTFGQRTLQNAIDARLTFRFVSLFLKTRKEAGSDPNDFDPDSDRTNIKVLVAEDVAINQLFMRTLLDSFGFECDIATNGKMAIEKLRARDYDIILMDLQMPEMNGFETTEFIRYTMNSEIPIIALTADLNATDLIKCKTAGMNDYISKPVDHRLLYSKIVGIVKKIQLYECDENSNLKTGILRLTNLDNLKQLTKSDPALMIEMITIYLDQTPPLIKLLKQGSENHDMNLLRSASHKLIPSFSIMGISHDFENMTRKVQEYAATNKETYRIKDLVLRLESICNQACAELEVELVNLKNTIQ